jgi:hypothetical protein
MQHQIIDEEGELHFGVTDDITRSRSILPPVPCFMFGLFFDPEERSRMFLRNIS